MKLRGISHPGNREAIESDPPSSTLWLTDGSYKSVSTSVGSLEQHTCFYPAEGGSPTAGQNLQLGYMLAKEECHACTPHLTYLTW